MCRQVQALCLRSSTRSHDVKTVNLTQPFSTYRIPGPTLALNAQTIPYDRQKNITSVYNGDGKPVKVDGTKTVPWVAKRTVAVQFAA
jgi:hypothetical protein